MFCLFQIATGRPNHEFSETEIIQISQLFRVFYRMAKDDNISDDTSVMHDICLVTVFVNMDIEDETADLLLCVFRWLQQTLLQTN